MNDGSRALLEHLAGRDELGHREPQTHARCGRAGRTPPRSGWCRDRFRRRSSDSRHAALCPPPRTSKLSFQRWRRALFDGRQLQGADLGDPGCELDLHHLAGLGPSRVVSIGDSSVELVRFDDGADVVVAARRTTRRSGTTPARPAPARRPGRAPPRCPLPSRTGRRRPRRVRGGMPGDGQLVALDADVVRLGRAAADPHAAVAAHPGVVGRTTAHRELRVAAGQHVRGLAALGRGPACRGPRGSGRAQDRRAGDAAVEEDRGGVDEALARRAGGAGSAPGRRRGGG